MSQKLTEITVEDYNSRIDDIGHKKIAIIPVVTLFAGGFVLFLDTIFKKNLIIQLR